MEIDPVARRDDIIGSFKLKNMIHELSRLGHFVEQPGKNLKKCQNKFNELHSSNKILH